MHSFYTHKNVLITGGCGFIGSHLAEKLVELGAHVTIIDNLSTGSLQNIANIKNSIVFLHKDITHFNDCLSATKNQEIIFHQAAFISVPESINNPTACNKINVLGTFNMLEAARCNNIDKFIFASSAAVYGNHEGICNENMACKPSSPYGFSKLIGEKYLEQYSTNFAMHTIALRYFNVFGERQNPQSPYAGVVAKFTDLIKNNKPLTVLGDGTQTRDFIPVADIVEANVKLAALPREQTKGQVFNIATGTSISLLKLIDQLKVQYPAYVQPISFAQSRPGDVIHSAADINRYRNLQNLY
jgi:nucleoside-diphosphate-sugar epimerase